MNSMTDIIAPGFFDEPEIPPEDYIEYEPEDDNKCDFINEK
jgi:hypothetical protein